MPSGADSASLAAQGHFQIMFSRQHCPLLQRRLSLFMKLMYSSGVWSYIVGALTTPTYILIPVLTVYAGIFPIVVSWWAAGEAPSAHPMQRFRSRSPLCLRADCCRLLKLCSLS